MTKKWKRVDTHIIQATPLAQRILRYLRELVHKGCPEVQEAIKWSIPSFDYKGPFFSVVQLHE